MFISRGAICDTKLWKQQYLSFRPHQYRYNWWLQKLQNVYRPHQGTWSFITYFYILIGYIFWFEYVPFISKLQFNSLSGCHFLTWLLRLCGRCCMRSISNERLSEYRNLSMLLNTTNHWVDYKDKVAIIEIISYVI